ncbi:MAG: hypothetical protein K8I00_11695 [Candidatus Omnitrophica bacterium]|nr:hypothetical protein [Candidatus Omnitrophota bacterium]
MMIHRKRSYYRKSQPSSLGKNLLKVFLVLLVFGAPVLVMVLFFKPFVSKKNVEHPVVRVDYKLPKGYQRREVSEAVKKMSDDPEYLFYFYAIEKDEILRATLDVYEILDRARSQESLLTEVETLQMKTKSLAVMFYHLDYDDGYIEDPTAFPELQKVLKTFLYEEFKLAILGVCYKSTYANDFRFEWDRTSQLAARKLHSILLRRRRAQK